MIELGKYTTLKMVRKSDLGFMLTDGTEDILLHFRQSKSEHKENDEVKVFIYADKERRLTATEIEPTVTIDDPGYVTVTEVMHGMGLFVNMGTPKDVLMSKDNLPYNEDHWPHVGERLFVSLKVKNGALLAKPMGRYDIIGLHKKVSYPDYTDIEGTIIRIGDKGVGIITKDLMYVYVPETQLRGTHHLGEEVTVTITKCIGEEYYGTLNKRKEEMIDSDKELIINYMKEHHNLMKLTAKTDSETVEKELKMSRKAFKRAYGALYKDRIIDFDEHGTFFVKKD